MTQARLVAAKATTEHTNDNQMSKNEKVKQLADQRPSIKPGKKSRGNWKPKTTRWNKVDPKRIIEAMTALGATHHEIAEAIGIKEDAFRVWQRTFPDLRLALKRGKEHADERVVNALYEKALSGDTTACIFWLKNRQPDKWRDRREYIGAAGVADGGPPLKLDNKRLVEIVSWIEGESTIKQIAATNNSNGKA